MENQIELSKINPIPNVFNRALTVAAGTIGRISAVGTAYRCIYARTVDAEGKITETQVKIQIGNAEPFYTYAGQKIDYKNFETAFNLIQVDNTAGTLPVEFAAQIAFLAEIDEASSVDSVNAQIAQEKKEREENDKALRETIAAVEAARFDGDALLDEKIKSGDNALSERIDSEKAAQSAENATLRELIASATLPEATNEIYGKVKLSIGGNISNASAPIGRMSSGVIVVPQATNSRFGAVKLSTSRNLGNDGGVIFMNSNGQILGVPALNTEKGVVFLANSVDDTRESTAVTPAILKAEIEKLEAVIAELNTKVDNLKLQPFILEKAVIVEGGSIEIPVSELNGNVSVQTNVDWISATPEGKIEVEPNN